MKTNLIFRQLFDEVTWTYTYIIGDINSKQALIIDPVKEKVDRDLQLISELWLNLTHIFDTHIHADHVTWSWLIREKIWAKIVLWKWASIANPDIIAEDCITMKVGDINIKIIPTPGHTEGCSSFLVEDMLFTGDTLLIRKTGRTDFQQWSAEKMFNSIKNKLYQLPDETKVYPWHDYMWYTMSTIWEEKKYNTRIKEDTTLENFTETMKNLKLDYPKYIEVAIPANMKLGMQG